MPNWTGNRLFVTGPRQDVERFRQQAAGEGAYKVTKKRKNKDEYEQGCLSFERFVPMMKKIARLSDNAAITLVERAWGCKWDAEGPVLVTHKPRLLRYEFGTPWSPPVRWLRRVSRMYPQLAFRMRYGGSEFRGVAEYVNGKGKDQEWYHFEV